MFSRTLRLFSCGFLLLALLSGSLLAAQDDAADGEATCDATLVTLLLVAIRDYGYEPPMRLDFYDFEQYHRLAEVTAGVTLVEDDTGESITAGERAQQLVGQAAGELSQEGLPAIGEGLSNLSDEIGAIVDAGEEALQAGQEAIQAGVSAAMSRDEGTLGYGALPNEDEACSLLRADLVDFMWDRLNAQAGLE